MHISVYVFIDAQPTLMMWSLDLDDNKITLQFSTPSLDPANNGMPTNCTAILIGPIAGDINVAMRLLPSVVGLQVSETMATCDLGMKFRSLLNSDSDLGTNLSNSYLYYEAIVGSDMSLLMDTRNIVYSNTMGTAASQVTSDINPPAIAGFEYLDLDEGLIVFSFTQPVNVTTFDISDLSLRNSPVDEVTAMNVSSTEGSCENGCEIGREVTLRISQTDLEKIKLEEDICVSISTCYPHHTSLLVEDFGGNLITMYRFGLNYLLKRLILDITPPILVSSELNLTDDNLVLAFDEPINVATFNPSGITLQYSENFTLTSASSVRGPSSSVVVVDLGLDADKLKVSIPDESGYDIISVSLLSSVFEDIVGNPVQSVSIQLHSIYADTIAPTVSYFNLDLNSNLLQIWFSEPILLESLNTSAFKLIGSSSVTGNMHTITLNDSFVFDSDDSLGGDAVRMISIAFGSQSLTGIKTSYDIGTTSNTYLLIDDHSFVDTNNNSFISAGPIPVAVVIADNSPATAIGFSLDMNIGQIVLTFNDVVNVSTWLNREAFIQRAAFNRYYSRVELSGTVMNGDCDIVVINIYDYVLNNLKSRSNYDRIAIDINSTYLTIRAHAINDINGVDIIAVTDDNAINANTYVRDTEPPQLIRFDLDLDSNRLRFYFDEPIASNSFNPSLFILQGDSLINTSSSVILSNNSLYHYCSGSGRYCYYYFPTDIANLLARNPNIARDVSTTYLIIMQGGVTDTSGNLINMVGPVIVNSYRPGRSKF